MQGGRRMKLARKTEFSAKARKAIHKRDRDQCVFCARGYRMEEVGTWAHAQLQVMHIVPRSQLGMGIEQNGVLGCVYHHTMMDNGNQGCRKEMQRILEERMKRLYPGWSRESVTYKKQWKV